MKRADMEDAARTQTKSRKKQSDQPIPDGMDAQPTSLEDVPTEPMVEDPLERTPDMNEPEDIVVDDTHDFYREVDDALDVAWDGPDLVEDEDEHMMTPLVDVLQTLGVSAADATMYAVRAVKNKPKQPTQFGSYQPTMIEIYGHGTIVNASHGCRRNLNVNGLHALDLRTQKPDGEPWDFSKSSDRRLAKSMVAELKPTWVIGSPPCTFFSAWNQGINHRKMDPARVEELRKEAVMHLHFMMGIYRIQIDGGRHFLHEHPASATSLNDNGSKGLWNILE